MDGNRAKMKGMKKPLLLLVPLLLVSCASTLEVSHLTPSKVDLSGRREIVVVPTSVGTVGRGGDFVLFDDGGWGVSPGFSLDAKALAEHTRQSLEATLSDGGYFRVGSEGGTVVETRLNSIDVLEEPSVEERDEWQNRVVDGVKQRVRVVTGRDYYLRQTVEVSLTYLVKDAESGIVLAGRTMKPRRWRRIQVASSRWNGDSFSTLQSTHAGLSPDGLVLEAIDSAISSIRSDLAPTQVNGHVRLRGKGEWVRLAKKGLYEEAIRVCLEDWKLKGSLEAGYDASLLKEAAGDLEGAVGLMREVVQAYPEDKKAQGALDRQLDALSENQAARHQMDGTTEAGESLKTTTTVVTEV